MLVLASLFFLGFQMNRAASFAINFLAEQALEDPYNPLPDIIHIYTPKISTIAPDLFLSTSFLYSVFNYNTWVDLDQNLWTLAICIILRSFSIFLTIMPTCMPEPRKIIQKTMYEKLFLSSHDLMFSGHSLFFICISNITQTPMIKYTGPLLLVIARQHYTIDVLGAGLVYYYVYNNI